MISIITLHLRREQHTRRFVERLYQHTHVPFELVIVSQGTTPHEVEWLEHLRREHPNLHLILNEQNVGTTKGRNQGAHAARGDFLVVVDNDVEVTDGWLEPLLETARGDASVAAVGAMILTPQGRPQYGSHYIVERGTEGDRPAIGLCFDRWLTPGAPEFACVREVPWYPTTCLLLRKDAFGQVGGFDERIFLAEEDKDLCLSLRQAGYRIVFNPHARVVHNGYPRDPDYAKLRENLPLLHQDKRYFEAKWSRAVINEASRDYLRESGVSEERLRQLERFPFFMQVIP